MCKHSHTWKGLSRRGFLGLGAAALGALALPRGAAAAAAGAPRVDLPEPGPRDTCPVCGMFVAKYPEWIATVLYRDGTAHHFDGAKDFFKYLLDLSRYAPGRTMADITGLGVTDYYSVERIHAMGALYVIGSDVYGPMGHELIPHASAADAAEFSRDHQGERTLRFNEVTMELLLDLDARGG